jgi:HK97 family phage prohead protease
MSHNPDSYHDTEKKHIDFVFEVKSIDENGVFTGYASIFDVVDSQKDVVLKGAFQRSLRERGVRAVKMLWQHRLEQPIGYYTQMKEDSVGLYVEGRLQLDIKQAQEAYELLKSGAISGLSIGYSVQDSDSDYTSGVRYIKDVDLWEVSLVTFPANEHASVLDVKGGAPENIREFERFLRDSGFSRSQAKTIASKGFCLDKEEVGDVVAQHEVAAAIDRCIGVLLG